MKELIKQANNYETVVDALTKYANANEQFGKGQHFMYEYPSYTVYLAFNNMIEQFMSLSLEGIQYIQDNELPESMYVLREQLIDLGLATKAKRYNDVQPN